jgi:hypothetical protein
VRSRPLLGASVELAVTRARLGAGGGLCRTRAIEEVPKPGNRSQEVLDERTTCGGWFFPVPVDGRSRAFGRHAEASVLQG